MNLDLIAPLRVTAVCAAISGDGGYQRNDWHNGNALMLPRTHHG
jgi:hypothetical protein